MLDTRAIYLDYGAAGYQWLHWILDIVERRPRNANGVQEWPMYMPHRGHCLA